MQITQLSASGSKRIDQLQDYNNKQLLDEVFVICGILAFGLADNTYLDLDNSAYHKNSIIVLLYISRKNKHCFTVLLPRFYICFLLHRIP